MSALSESVGDAWVITGRNLRKIKRVPDLLVFTILSPIMFMLLFRYVFGGAIAGSFIAKVMCKYAIRIKTIVKASVRIISN